MSGDLSPYGGEHEADFYDFGGVAGWAGDMPEGFYPAGGKKKGTKRRSGKTKFKRSSSRSPSPLRRLVVTTGLSSSKRLKDVIEKNNLSKKEVHKLMRTLCDVSGVDCDVLPVTSRTGSLKKFHRQDGKKGVFATLMDKGFSESDLASFLNAQAKGETQLIGEVNFLKALKRYLRSKYATEVGTAEELYKLFDDYGLLWTIPQGNAVIKAVLGLLKADDATCDEATNNMYVLAKKLLALRKKCDETDIRESNAATELCETTDVYVRALHGEGFYDVTREGTFKIATNIAAAVQDAKRDLADFRRSAQDLKSLIVATSALLDTLPKKEREGRLMSALRSALSQTTSEDEAYGSARRLGRTGAVPGGPLQQSRTAPPGIPPMDPPSATARGSGGPGGAPWSLFAGGPWGPPESGGLAVPSAGPLGTLRAPPGLPPPRTAPTPGIGPDGLYVGVGGGGAGGRNLSAKSIAGLKHLDGVYALANAALAGDLHYLALLDMADVLDARRRVVVSNAYAEACGSGGCTTADTQAHYRDLVRQRLGEHALRELEAKGLA